MRRTIMLLLLLLFLLVLLQLLLLRLLPLLLLWVAGARCQLEVETFLALVDNDVICKRGKPPNAIGQAAL